MESSTSKELEFLKELLNILDVFMKLLSRPIFTLIEGRIVFMMDENTLKYPKNWIH